MLQTITLARYRQATEQAKQHGAKGLAWAKWLMVMTGPVAKFLTDLTSQLTEALQLENNDLVLFVADTLEVANAALGALRVRLAKELDLIDPDTFTTFG